MRPTPLRSPWYTAKFSIGDVVFIGKDVYRVVGYPSVDVGHERYILEDVRHPMSGWYYALVHELRRGVISFTGPICTEDLYTEDAHATDPP